ncbi:hypothetical protein G6F46_009277 [Rhizopus delemar]|uniref:Reverse transcriptase domain-containing protein n=2 Tax=Rhizopus TaxID=4842 RepID=A0A9P7CK44_9FUNG|nr:hypothetical protein G6F55_008246 [Rhizopus delemar]KAG1536615.1 hypothetical protein G6F51_010867 [Rhizopus arrhizus]KAG1523796.1 hypothetical protein G6F52_004723 [Rhizopus delemar]KAG1555430.1 hypothetical protein G6F49_007170 [Rhizopus delemar]KAG1564822.1 hypothetical protein G6F50_010655 [Rhizopus delemar]
MDSSVSGQLSQCHENRQLGRDSQFSAATPHHMILSVIDYIYLGSELHQCLSNTAITCLHPAWSDHSILQSTYTLGASKFGPGLWRADPSYASHQPLQQKLEKGISKLLQRTDLDRTPQQQWEEVRILTAKIIRSYSIAYVEWQSQTIKTLEKKRNRILRTKPSPAIRLQLIPPIDLQLQTLQKELAEIARLKSRIHWQENGENNITYLKGMHKKRTLEQCMTEFEDPTAADPTVIHSEPTLMRNIVNTFYQQLYTVDPDRIQHIRDYLGTVNFDHEISEAEDQKLQQKFDFDDIIYMTKRCPKQSSPGSDGLGLEHHPRLGLLLDQEKAYDRVLPEYLLEMLRMMKSPESYQDYLPSDGTDSQCIKCIAYADDICAFVKDVADFDRLQFHMAQYNTVSNSKFNKDKTEAFSLDGCKSQSWSALLQSNHITTYHCKHSPSAFRYLGYYLPYTIMQRDSIQNMLLEKLKAQFQIYSQRQLSLRGRASIANLLVLSKIWRSGR